MVDIRQHGDMVLMRVHVQPGAKQTECAGVHGDAVRIRLTARAQDNKANRACVEFIADSLGLPVRRVEIKSGHKSRRKLVVISGVDEVTVKEKMLGYEAR